MITCLSFCTLMYVFPVTDILLFNVLSALSLFLNIFHVFFLLDVKKVRISESPDSSSVCLRLFVSLLIIYSFSVSSYTVNPFFLFLFCFYSHIRYSCYFFISFVSRLTICFTTNKRLSFYNKLEYLV
jgi:hypothetical protein